METHSVNVIWQPEGNGKREGFDNLDQFSVFYYVCFVES